VRINVTMDERLVAAIDRAAKREGGSRSGFLANAAREKLGLR
jgi:metal-responsive CopG/Arc/MetJ family transcriptional regulator